jgi:nucleotide-binding universal stress UspA family protein
MYDRILVPTDGSDAAGYANRRAIDLAARYDAQIHALFVTDTSGYVAFDSVRGSGSTAVANAGEEAVAAVERAAKDADIDVITAVVEGVPHRAILDYVEANGIDLVVMGTHGRSGLGRYLLGSVTERVVRSSPVPVLTVRRPDATG